MISNPADGHPEVSASGSTETSKSSIDRKEVFRVLVQLQDLGETVETSRARVSAQFNLPHDDLVEIEREGISSNWPPL